MASFAASTVPNGTTAELPQFKAGKGSTGQVDQLTVGRGETSHVETDPRGKSFHVEAETCGISARVSGETGDVSNLDTPAGGGESPSATPKRIVDLIVVTYWHKGKQVR